jgi:hypothetical protein
MVWMPSQQGKRGMAKIGSGRTKVIYLTREMLNSIEPNSEDDSDALVWLLALITTIGLLVAAWLKLM